MLLTVALGKTYQANTFVAILPLLDRLRAHVSPAAPFSKAAVQPPLQATMLGYRCPFRWHKRWATLMTRGAPTPASPLAAHACQMVAAW